jgi:5-methylcytosine-specific restriction endonuclease McrA
MISPNASKIPKEHFIKICNESESMASAASNLKLHFNTFKKYALKYDCYYPNQGGKNISKDIKPRIFNIDDFNNNKPIKSTRAAIRRHIIDKELLDYKCSECGIKEWKGKKISLHLDHIDGKQWNHIKSNLRWLCPNCHSQTKSYCGKNK